MHIYVDPCCYISDLPGVNPATDDRMILYYCLMTKVDWFRRLYGIFLGGLSQKSTLDTIHFLLYL
jgi:hypothetical protein